MKLLILGGAGLIGSHLTRRLVDAGHRVLCLDAFRQSYTPVPHPQQTEFLGHRHEVLLKGAHVVCCSTLEPSRLRGEIMGFEPEVVVHLAAIPLVSVATAHVERAFPSLATGLVNVLEILREASFVRRFVYASSSMVYGDFTIDPMPEDGPQAPLNIYGGLKLAGEVMTRAYLHPTEIEPVIVRPSAVYGPTDLHRRVAQKFCESALDGTPLLVKAANDHIMDFTYVEDIAEGFLLACTHPAAAGETFNMSYGQGRRLTELVAVLRQLVPTLRTSGEDINDSDRPRRGGLSVRKAGALLGYAPQWPLERGIPVYLEHLRRCASSGAMRAGTG